MNRCLGAAFAVALLALSPALGRADEVPLTYPPAVKGDAVDDYFGTKVSDPYRWLEDLESSQTKAWVAAQAALTESYLSTIPARQALRDRLRALWNYERVSAPTHEADTYLISRNSGLQNQAVVYASSGESGSRRVLLDPNGFSSDGAVALGGQALSPNGKLFAYATHAAGSDWLTWHVRGVASGKDLSDTIRWSQSSRATWTKDSSGFYYSAYDPPKDAKAPGTVNSNQKAFFHKVGTPQTADKLVYVRPDHKDWLLNVAPTEDGRYLLYYTSKGSDSGLLYRDLATPGSHAVELFANERAQYDVVDNDGPLFYVQTNADATHGKLIALDVRHPKGTREIVPESDATLQNVSSAGGLFFASYLKDAHTQVKVFDRRGRLLREVALPGIGAADGFSGHRADRVTYYAFTGYTSPTTIYRYDITSGKSTLYYKPVLKFDAAQFVTEQIFCMSKDGTRVPMFISYKKDLAIDGSAPAILFGDGGFDVSLTPVFSPAVAMWMELGGVYAVANLRGGGEYGEAWHKAGMLDHKQNVFDDFAAAAAYLTANKYTSTPKLAIKGEVNGGLLCGATVTQHPELFGAALCAAGVMDMLRFQKFSGGSMWIPEYGSAEANQTQFKTLAAYSPLLNLKPGMKYPPTLISTPDHDDQVFPAHSFKFAATMQADQEGTSPVLLFVESKAGHSESQPLQKMIDETADQYAFLVKALDFKPQPGSG